PTSRGPSENIHIYFVRKVSSGLNHQRGKGHIMAIAYYVSHPLRARRATSCGCSRSVFLHRHMKLGIGNRFKGKNDRGGHCTFLGGILRAPVPPNALAHEFNSEAQGYPQKWPLLTSHRTLHSSQTISLRRILTVILFRSSA